MKSDGPDALNFYRFLGVHSLLIGLFPFFIPVYLWNKGFTLSQICLFIAVSGIAFCATLRVWELAASKVRLSTLFGITLVLELVLLSINLLPVNSALFLVIFGLGNGVYNCFFWTTQRSLFVDIITNKNSGRQYGNFQIFVMVFLKGGILIGGLTLEHYGFLWVFGLSTIIAISSIYYFSRLDNLASPLPAGTKVTISTVLNFKDQNHSRTIFLVDGLFLFLESHLWTVSLFLYSNENYAQFGMIVIALAIIFAILFFLTKNLIDQLMGQRVFQIAVIVYALSWIGRSVLERDGNTQLMLGVLLVVTFMSSFFRLTFNKRFYDIANESNARHYLIIKSYYTQFSVAVCYLALAAVFLLTSSPELTLKATYLCSAVAALLYLRYQHIKQ